MDYKAALLIISFFMAMLISFGLVIKILDHFCKGDSGNFGVRALFTILLWTLFYSLNLIL
jgi:hypothetical protein